MQTFAVVKKLEIVGSRAICYDPGAKFQEESWNSGGNGLCSSETPVYYMLGLLLGLVMDGVESTNYCSWWRRQKIGSVNLLS